VGKCSDLLQHVKCFVCHLCQHVLGKWHTDAYREYLMPGTQFTNDKPNEGSPA